MKDPRRFYTYAYLREDGTPYYVGKGEGNRAYTKSRNEKIKPPKNKSRIIFLKKNLLEEEAFTHEKYMIFVFGRKDLGTGILRNMSDGGEGPSGAIRSKETRRKMGEAKRNMNENARRRMGDAKRGLKWWNDGNGKIIRSIECPGEGWFPGLGEEHRKNSSKGAKNTRWWNDGCGNVIRSIECPGPNWVPGFSEENKKKMREAKRDMGEDIRKKYSEAKRGMKWWNDRNGNTRFTKECPGDGWVPGRGKINKDT